ncbi:MAG: hypothetical protein OXG35_33385 [Acidobacteria bacterium]|nr:hypothetical protein [Acidobacteriota bacterium]
MYAHLETDEERQQAVDDYVRDIDWDPSVHNAVLDAEAAWEAEHRGEDPPMDAPQQRDDTPEQQALPIPEAVQRPSAQTRYERPKPVTRAQSQTR